MEVQHLRRNAWTGPGCNDLYASLLKKIQLSESYCAQFPLEAFNEINHTNFNPPLDNNVMFDEPGAARSGHWDCRRNADSSA
jgi:hypothetical protein